MKAGKTHIVPLAPAAISILEQLRKAYGTDAERPIFPGNAGKPLSDMTLTKALRDAGFDGITVHGFRSTFRDWAAEQTDTANEVVESALAHTIQNRVEAAYRRTNYLEKRWALMLSWAKYVAGNVPVSNDKTDKKKTSA